MRISPIRVVNFDGEMLGVIETSEAQARATEVGMDLVEVAPNERPPVCRIMDYGKFKYEQKKKLSKNTKQHQVQLKEIRLRPKIGEHDVDFKMKKARDFLLHHDKVKLTVMFKGRENAHHERGLDILKSMVNSLDDIAKLEKPPGMDGRMMTAILAPK
ncbi:MAG: translation initiation factor IF-3 [Planctomycetaceae bacterium]|nr:translation initiation factor IF-3 [Planctomycetaceae bacterium]